MNNQVLLFYGFLLRFSLLSACAISIFCGAVLASSATARTFDESEQYKNLVLYTDTSDFVKELTGEKPINSMISETNYLLLKRLNAINKVQYQISDRHTQILESEQPACSLYKIKTPEREKRFLFSLPTDVFLAHKLYQLSENPIIATKHLTKDGQVSSINDMFNSAEFKGKLLLLDGRSYGDDLDKLLTKINTDKLEFINARQPYASYLKLFELKREDYVIAFPSIIHEHPTLSRNTRSYQIQGIDSHVSGRIMCNDTKETRAFLHAANKELKRLYDSSEFYLAISRYLPSTSHDLLAQIINDTVKIEAYGWLVNSATPSYSDDNEARD